MSYRLSLLSPAEAMNFTAMTFPAYRSLLGKPGIAVCARQGDVPVGLALCGGGQGSGDATLLSLFVSLMHRKKGLGTVLLDSLETVLAARGITQLNTVWSENMPGSEGFVRVLEKSDWSSPARSMLVMHADMAGRFGQGIRREGSRYALPDCLPRRYSMLSWTDITAADRAFIRSRQGHPGWHAEQSDPFREENILDPRISRLLKKDGDIVGWLTVHRPSLDTARFTDVFIRQPSARSGAVAVAMVIHGFWLLMEERVSRLTWAIRSDNKPLVAMCQNRLGHLADLHWTWGASKRIAR